jgi:hypothetical protein
MTNEPDSTATVEGGATPPMSAAELLRAAAVPSEVVSLEGVGAVRVRGMTAGEAGKIGQMHNRGQGDRLAAQLACWCLQNEDGSPMFQAGQVAELMGWRADLLQPIADAVLRLSGLEGGADAGLADAQGN